MVCASLVLRGGRTERWIALAVLLGTVVKAVLELALGRSLLTGSVEMGGVTVFEAHFVGVLSGMAWVLAETCVLRPGMPRRHA